MSKLYVRHNGTSLQERRGHKVIIEWCKLHSSHVSPARLGRKSTSFHSSKVLSVCRYLNESGEVFSPIDNH